MPKGKRPGQKDCLKAVTTTMLFLVAVMTVGNGGHAMSTTAVNPALCVESSS